MKRASWLFSVASFSAVVAEASSGSWTATNDASSKELKATFQFQSAAPHTPGTVNGAFRMYCR